MRKMLLTRSIGSYIHIQPPGGCNKPLSSTLYKAAERWCV